MQQNRWGKRENEEKNDAHNTDQTMSQNTRAKSKKSK